MLYFLSVFPLPSRTAQMLMLDKSAFYLLTLESVLLLVSLMFQVHLHLRCIPVPEADCYVALCTKIVDLIWLYFLCDSLYIACIGQIP